jgi:VIT1/CCC1 family predicted Fe2+/Mn2+ transporter
VGVRAGQRADLRALAKREQNRAEEREGLALFYQLKGVPEDEAQALATRLMTQPQSALQMLVSEELGLSEQNAPSPWTAALSATLSTASGAFIPIVPFIFPSGYVAIIASFAISTLAHFLIAEFCGLAHHSRVIRSLAKRCRTDWSVIVRTHTRCW